MRLVVVPSFSSPASALTSQSGQLELRKSRLRLDSRDVIHTDVATKTNSDVEVIRVDKRTRLADPPSRSCGSTEGGSNSTEMLDMFTRSGFVNK